MRCPGATRRHRAQVDVADETGRSPAPIGSVTLWREARRDREVAQDLLEVAELDARGRCDRRIRRPSPEAANPRRW